MARALRVGGPMVDQPSHSRYLGICGALSKRGTGVPCHQKPVGMNGRCRLHGGGSLGRWKHPKPEVRLVVTAKGILLSLSRVARGRWPKERARFAAEWPKRIGVTLAKSLVRNGTVKVAVVHGSEGERLLREVERFGIKLTWGGTERGGRVVRFEVPQRLTLTGRPIADRVPV